MERRLKEGKAGMRGVEAAVVTRTETMGLKPGWEQLRDSQAAGLCNAKSQILDNEAFWGFHTICTFITVYPILYIFYVI